MRRNRLRVYALVAAAAMAGAAFAVLPALGDNHPDALRLHLGTNGQYFQYGDTTQTLTANRCEVQQLSGPLVVMPRRTGLDSNGLGVKSGGSQGTPCGRVDTTETLDIAIHDVTGSALEGRMFSGLRLDLELKGNAWITLDLYADGALVEKFRLATGSSIATSGYPNPSDSNPDGGYTVMSDPASDSAGGPDSHFVACAGLSDSGPDSGANDNCVWTVLATQQFDQIKITAQVGEFSLEGSGDFGNLAEYDTLFYVANAAPTANDDTASTTEDASTTVSVLGNDTDPDGDDLRVVSVTALQSDGTTATVGAVNAVNGVITYDPRGYFDGLAAGATGSDEFTYTITDDNGGSDSAVVRVTVTGLNDLPVIGATTASGSEGTPTDIDLNVTDPDDTSWTTSCTSTDGTFVPDAAGDGTGTFTTTDPYKNGTVALSCSVEDGEDKVTAAVTLSLLAVNDSPVAVDDVAEANNDESILIDVTSNDSDVDNPNEVFQVAVVASTVPTGFTASEESGQIRFRGPVEWVGPVTFDYTITDSGGLSDTGTVTVYEVIECGESLEVSEGLVTARYTRLSPAGSGCDYGKPYDLDILSPDNPDDGVTEPIVEFVPRQPQDAADTVVATFSAELSFEPMTKVDGGADTGGIDYDVDSPGPEWDPMPWCVSSDIDVTVVDGEITEILVTAAVLPDGHTWCIAYKRTFSQNSADIRTIWTVYGTGDPFKRGS